MSTKLNRLECDSPIGKLILAATPTALCALEFEDHWTEGEARLRRAHRSIEFEQGGALLEKIRGQLAAYFDGAIGALAGIPVQPRGTAFQERVWAQLQKIAPGRTASYGEIARALGLRPGASRAIGAANGANPIAIVIPCHRVIRGDGSLCGYGGGVDRKQWLLRHEHAVFS